jgi:hypothetical protein
MMSGTFCLGFDEVLREGQWLSTFSGVSTPQSQYENMEEEEEEQNMIRTAVLPHC